MNSIKRAAAVATIAWVAAIGASPTSADVISNPTNTDSFVYLSGALQGGQQTQFVGQTFNAPITGPLTGFQFTLNSSTITSLYGAVYAWNGSKPTTLLWQSPVNLELDPDKWSRSFRLLAHGGKRYARPDLCGVSSVRQCCPFSSIRVRSFIAALS
jgi:hypothetical protein